MRKYFDRIRTSIDKKSRLIIGLMSGTSLDGLDVALCEISGSGPDTSVKLKAFCTQPYTEMERQTIKKIFAKEVVDLSMLCAIHPWIGLLHAQIINSCLLKWDIRAEDIDCIASHGQTVMHAPMHQHKWEDFPNATLQLGDGDHIARYTGIITISDFRQKHIAAGGEGAPLAVYGDCLIFSSHIENRIMLNIGGIANFTYLPIHKDYSKVFVTDTGPGNTMMDAYIQSKGLGQYDKDAMLARSGTVSESLLNALMETPFLSYGFPKTTGPEVFNLSLLERCQALSHQTELSMSDIMATLNYFSALTISQAIKKVIGEKEFTIYLSGGGMHNPLLINNIQALLPQCTFGVSDTLGVTGDAKEAVLFAILANELLCGDINYFDNNPSLPAVTMGKISFP